MRCISRRPSSPSCFPAWLALAFLLAFAPRAQAQRAAAAARGTVAPAVHGLDVAGMDRAVPPGDDFFEYANGTWVRTTPIPPDLASLGVFTMLEERTGKQVSDLIVGLGKMAAAPGSDARKIGDYYASYLDQAAIDARGIAPLRPILAGIGAIADRQALARVLGGTLRADVDILNSTNLHTSNLFGLWVAQDLSDPRRYSPFLLQGGLGMPDRQYYLDPSPRMAAIRAKYQEHIAAMLRLAGFADAPARAARVLELEHRIAQVHWGRAETEEVSKGNNHMTLAELERRAPGLDWPTFFAAAGLGGQQEFVIWQPSAFTGIAALVGSEPIESWKDWLAFHAIDQRAAVLPKAFAEQAFVFYGGVLSGTTEQRARWKQAVDATNEALGDAVGRLYAARYFPPQSKAQVQGMVRGLIAAFQARIDRLDWMAPTTRTNAKKKLAALIVGIGYPDRWTDYSSLRVVRGDAFGNAERAQLFQLRRSLAKLGRPVDRTEWAMTPQTVNAVNLPAMNALNFPAAILQPPFFDPARTAAENYGAIGAIIGHEISHSFDDQGALFDATGKLSNWWTPADFAHFQAAAARLVAQFDQYRPFPDLHVNGKQTLSENIADVAGLSAAYDAWKASLRGQPAPVAQGFTGDQQLFLSFGQSWRTKYREPALRQTILTNGHAPGMYRADTVRNIDAWYPAFGVKLGEKLALPPQDRVRIW